MKKISIFFFTLLLFFSLSLNVLAISEIKTSSSTTSANDYFWSDIDELTVEDGGILDIELPPEPSFDFSLLTQKNTENTSETKINKSHTETNTKPTNEIEKENNNETIENLTTETSVIETTLITENKTTNIDTEEFKNENTSIIKYSKSKNILIIFIHLLVLIVFVIIFSKNKKPKNN